MPLIDLFAEVFTSRLTEKIDVSPAKRLVLHDAPTAIPFSFKP